MGASIHIWTITLDDEPAMVGPLADVLSGAERVRAARLRTTELRVRFVVAHGALRTILSGYLGIPAKAVRFDTTETGKPLCGRRRPDLQPLALRWSRALRHHGRGAGRCRHRAAATRGGRRRDRPSVFSLPPRCVSTEAVRSQERTAAFFSTWTRKEAFVKAVGTGLQRELSSFEVEVSPARGVSAADARARGSARQVEPALVFSSPAICRCGCAGSRHRGARVLRLVGRRPARRLRRIPSRCTRLSPSSFGVGVRRRTAGSTIP